jgi:hypothetical protein
MKADDYVTNKIRKIVFDTFSFLYSVTDLPGCVWDSLLVINLIQLYSMDVIYFHKLMLFYEELELQHHDEIPLPQ